MAKLLVNAPTGRQELIEIGEGGDYYDASRVLWDERVDGHLPEGITVGGMTRVAGVLVFDAARLAEHEAAVSVVPVPPAVAMWAGRRAIIEAGIDLADIDAHIDAINDATARQLAKSDWEYQTHIYRASSLVAQVASGLGLTGGQIDALFVRAAEIEAARF